MASISKDMLITLTNMSNQKVVYSVPSLFIRREFNGFQSMEVTADEVRKLWFERGGKDLLTNYLCIENDALALELGINVKEVPEYKWKKQDILHCLNSDNIDILLDALDFAPAGIIDSIVYFAVETKIPDTRKREIISESTGYSVDNRIKNKETFLNSQENTSRPKRRRVSTDTTRRVQEPKEE